MNVPGLRHQAGAPTTPDIAYFAARLIALVRTASIEDGLAAHLERNDAEMAQDLSLAPFRCAGPGSSDGSYFLRDTSQVDQLLRFFVEQAVAGVTVRGGSLHARRHPDGRLSGPSANQQLLLAEGMRRRMPIRLAPDPKRVGGPQGQTPKAWGPLTTSDAIKDG
eukprot:scaffold92277_cov30-Tisochrysis_lutea.AAC.2